MRRLYDETLSHMASSTHTLVVLNMGRLSHETSISCGWIVRRRRQPT